MCLIVICTVITIHILLKVWSEDQQHQHPWGGLLEMHILRPHPRPPDSEPASWQDLQVTMGTLQLEKSVLLLPDLNIPTLGERWAEFILRILHKRRLNSKSGLPKVI